jgi:hypothetical protein
MRKGKERANLAMNKGKGEGEKKREEREEGRGRRAALDKNERSGTRAISPRL